MAAAKIFKTERQAVLWLLMAQLLAILPRLDILPIWVVMVWAAIAFWYWRIVTVAWSFPPRWLKLLLALASIFAVYFSFQSLFALEAMIGVLILAVILKLLELRTARDHWLLLMLCYFIVACGFLFSQNIGSMFIAMVQVGVILMAQQALHRLDARATNMLRLLGVMALQSLPLMLILFVIFPRIGPLWTMPLPGGNQARTGMSDHLEFGDIAKLSQSADLAFRVKFQGELPSSENLYWRGLVLDEFDGRRWTGKQNSLWLEKIPAPSLSDSAIAYTVTLEPGSHKWLYALPVASVKHDEVYYTPEHQWLASQALSGRLQYTVRSDLKALLTDKSTGVARSLRLTGQGNPQSRALAAQWQEQFAEPEERVAAALDFYRTNPFIYTLSPTVLGKDNVDEFLFSSKQGFCEHFAGSFVFLMRAAGVPARIVVGYQGGEYNREDNYLLVHQSDAHAWAEVWLEQRGWVRIDPTATVAPDRIRSGADALLQSMGGYLSGSPLSLRRFAWATKLRYFVDNINYAWARWVLNYDTDIQNQFLLKILGDINPQRLLILLMIGGGLPLGFAAFFSLRLTPRVGEDLASRYYLQSCRALSRRGGVSRLAGETPQQFLQRVKVEAPCWGDWLAGQTRLFSEATYHHQDSEDAVAILRSLKRGRRPQKNLGQNKISGLKEGL
jgi:transglutaminase-like putative cysteine protease